MCHDSGVLIDIKYSLMIFAEQSTAIFRSWNMEPSSNSLEVLTILDCSWIPMRGAKTQLTHTRILLIRWSQANIFITRFNGKKELCKKCKSCKCKQTILMHWYISNASLHRTKHQTFRWIKDQFVNFYIWFYTLICCKKPFPLLDTH